MPRSTEKQTPQDASYDVWKDEQVKQGLDDIAAGRTILHAELVRDMDAYMKKLARKHAKAA